jgi:hypothetical protein
MRCACLQVGQYSFSVAPPSTLPGTTVLGSPVNVFVKAGLADVSHSSVAVTVPPSPLVGSSVTAHVTLADLYGNPITAPEAGQYTNSLLVIQGAHLGACSCCMC